MNNNPAVENNCWEMTMIYNMKNWK